MRRVDELLRVEPLLLRLAAPVADLDPPALRPPDVDRDLLAAEEDLAVEREDDPPPVFFAADVREPVPDLRDDAPEPELEPPLRDELEERALEPPLRDEPDERRAPLLLEVELPSMDHLPDMTRCAASATASAINDPSLVALDMTDFAALSALSAASMPASLIALRAFGLALIAAAAAARPAASISLLIAALASFSVVDRDEPDDDLDDFELLRVLDFAIAKTSFAVAALDK